MTAEPNIPADPPAAPASRLQCGLVMPISAIDNCSKEHWIEVRAILEEAIQGAGFTPNLVSDANDSGVIQKLIVENLYTNPIVVCDVSGKNPNVMFELGMRLTFDKAAVVVKDDATCYSFDTSPIEHLPYRRDLRYPDIVAFKLRLTEKIKGTHEKAKSDKNYSTFLKHFGTFTVPQLDTKEVSKEDYIISQLNELMSIARRQTPLKRRFGTPKREPLTEAEIVARVLDKYQKTERPNALPSLTWLVAESLNVAMSMGIRDTESLRVNVMRAARAFLNEPEPTFS